MIHRTLSFTTSVAESTGALFALLIAGQSVLLPQTAATKLPARLDDYLATIVRPTEAERRNLLAGQPIAKVLDGDPNTEVPVFGAVWVKAPIRRYVEAMRNIETFERGKGFRATKRISAPPTIEDFSAMHIPLKDLEDMRSCRVGDCEVKLSEQALRRFQTEVDWRAPNLQAAGDAVMRQLALEYVEGYPKGGIGN